MLTRYLSIQVVSSIQLLLAVLRYLLNYLKNIGSKTFFFILSRHFRLQLVSLGLIISMLSATTFSQVPGDVLRASMGEIGQDIRYGFLSSPTVSWLAELSLLDNPVLGFFYGKGKKQQNIVKIEVSPNRATIREGEEIAFTAVALDGKDIPVQGVSFKWTAVSENKKAAPMIMSNGRFSAPFAGGFEITAETGGIRSTARIRVIKDPQSLALKEAERQFRENGAESSKRGEKRGQVRQDVQKLLAESKAVTFNNSSRMSDQEVKELNRAEEDFKKQLPKKIVDLNKKFPPIKKAPPAEPIDPRQSGEAGTDEAEAKEAGRQGGPSPREENNAGENKVFYPVLSGSLNAVTGSNITGCGNDGMGWSGAQIELYIDGGVYGGTYLDTDIASPGCNFSYPIPAAYQDGQTHSVSAYIWDYNSSSYYELNNSPQSFQISSGGGGTNSNWNNNNYNTADNPGVQPGTPANTGTDGAGSSNFSFAAPILSLGGRGMDVNLALSYNSLLWHNDGTNISYDIDKGSPAPGWNLGFGKMMDMGSNGGAMIEDLDGTRHSYEGANQTWGSYSTYYGKTTDGSFVDYFAYRGPSGLYSGMAYLANGTQISYGAAANGVLYPTQIKDRHGNLMTIAYQSNQGPRISTVTDNLGRVVTFNYDGNNRLVSISGPAQNNGTRVYVRIHYAQKTVTPSFSGLTPQVRDANPYQIDAIYYPDLNTGYWFGDNDSYSSYGMIAKVKEMRGMSWSGVNNNDQGTISQGTMSRQMVYNYLLTASSLTAAPQYTTMTEDWAGRDTGVPTAVTNYSINNNASPRTTTITLPNGNQLKQYSYNNPNQWNDGLLYQIETIASPTASPGSNISPNQTMSKLVTSWQQGDYNSSRVTEILSTDEKSQTSKQTFTYDTYYNQVATVSEYGYSNNLLRKKVNTYENNQTYRGYYSTISGQNVWSSGRHIFSLVKTEEIQDASNNRLSRNDYNYDQATLTNTPGVVMYDDTFNPHTTGTIQGPNCYQWDYQWNGWDYEYYCVQYEQVPNFDSTTLARGNVTQTTGYADAGGLSGAVSHNYTYDITGNQRTATTDCCEQMSFAYSTNTQYSQPDSQTKGSPTNAAQQITESATYDFNTGHLAGSTDFNGRTTLYAYDPVNRLSVVNYPTGASRNLWYNNGSGNSASETVWTANNASVGSYTESFMNGRGQQIKGRSFNQQTGNFWDAANFTETVAKYDEMGRTKEVSIPFSSAAGNPNNYHSTYQYDQLSRVTQVTAPDGSTSKTFYNEPSKPSSGITTSGNTVRSQDAWGRERWARTDDFGRLVEVVEPDPTGTGSVFAAGNVQTQYTYNALDQLQQVNQGSQVRMFWYDSLGRLVRQKLAEQNGSLAYNGQFVGGNNGGWSDVFVYDNRSNLIQRTDARGVKTNFNYNNDPLNRLQQVTYDKTGADPTRLIYDTAPTNLSYMTTGDKTRVKRAETWVWVEENSYDLEGRISEYKLSGLPSGQEFTTNYLYDTLSRLTEVRYPAQYGMAGNPRKTVTPSYDETSRLKELKVDNQIQMSEIVYNPLSQVTSLKTGAATGNADVEQYTYDGQTGLLTNQIVKKQNSNQQLLNLSYNYNRGNSKGSINGKTGQLTNVVDNLNRNKDKIYEFDTLGRLMVARGGAAGGGVQTQGTPPVVANWTQSYFYDRYGNKLGTTANGVTQNSQTVPTDGWGSMSYDNASNRITTAGYQYDLAGNLIRGQKPDGTWQKFGYDTTGRLVQVFDDAGNSVEAYAYASSRQRLVKNAGGSWTYYAWGGSSVIAEYTNTDWNTAVNWSKSYIYAGSRLLSTFTKNGAAETLEFHHPDRLGTKLVTNNTANTSFEQSTLPFGTALDAETTGTTNQRFTSYDRSTVASLDYAVNRSYSSGQGRFTSVDPIGFGASSLDNPQSFNLYAYVGNNPIDFVDPSGLDDDGWGPPEIGGGEVFDWYGFMYGFRDKPKEDPTKPEEPGGGGSGGSSGADDAEEEWRKCRAQADADFDPFKPNLDADKLKSYNTAIARANEDFMEEVRNKNEDFWESVMTTLVGAVIGGFIGLGAGGLLGGEIGAAGLNPLTIAVGVIGGALIGAIYGIWQGARRKNIDLSREKGKFDKAVRRAKEDYPEVLPFLDWAERKLGSYTKCDIQLTQRRMKPF